MFLASDAPSTIEVAARIVGDEHDHDKAHPWARRRSGWRVITPEWWDAVSTHPHTLLTDLVEGFNVIAAQPIPFRRLPPRVRAAYGADAAVWSDLGEETPSSLRNRQGMGVIAVRAVVAAAAEAVAVTRSTTDRDDVDAETATRDLIARLTERDRDLLARRRWSSRPETLEQAGCRLGVHEATVQRHQRRADARFAELVADPVHRRLVDYADGLRRRLGTLTRPDTARRALRELTLEPGSETGDLVLHLAGPYASQDGWLQNTKTAGLRMAEETVDSAFATRSSATVEDLTRGLQRIGIVPEAIDDFLASRPGMRRVTDRWLFWGSSVPDKAAAGLELLGTPATAETIAHAIAETTGEGHPVQAVLSSLSDDHRFVRTTRLLWALRAWELPEYAGVYGEIAERIDAAGRSIAVTVVTRDILSAFPDIATSSIRTNLSAPGFVIEHGAVRRRTETDRWPAAGPLNAVRGAFRNGAREIRMAIPVDSDLLRGSGRRLAAAVAVALGVRPGQRRTFTGSLGELTLTWRPSSTTGATVGSLRALASAIATGLGDTIVLIFDTGDGTFSAQQIRADDDSRQRLRILLGRPVTDPIAAAARSLGCRPDDVEAVLRRRDEEHLIAHLRAAQPTRTNNP